MPKKETQKINLFEGKQDKVNIWLLMGLVVGLGALVMFISYQGEKEEAKLGRAVCEFYNVSFNYARGEHTHCFILDNKTGFKKDIDIWLDLDIAKRLYLNKTPAQAVQKDNLYYMPKNQSVMPTGCESISHAFNVSGQRVECYRCVDTNLSLYDAVPAGSWICPM